MGWSDEFRFRDCPWCGAHVVQVNVLSALNQAASSAINVERYWVLLGCPRCGDAAAVQLRRTLEPQPFTLG